VKLSSEAAEAISLTRVVVQEMPFRELLEQILVLTGKDRERIRELLRRGTLVIGASRFRWDGWSVEDGELESVLRSFPDPEPLRSFDARACVRAVLRDRRGPIEITREAASRRGWLRRESFWDRLMQAVAAAPKVYRQYSYRDRADVYEVSLQSDAAGRLRQASPLLRFSTLRDQIRRADMSAAELFVERR
jgi:hypothetical protein